MSVYIDNAFIPYRNMKMCHMVADSLEELHSMADLIGLKREWFQNKSNHPHYDVGINKRNLAIKNGAVEVNTTELVKIIWRVRGQ